ncbi:hypothetical protein RCO27_06140 [Sphingosinicella sp. LHD-64]|uniref:hypothetical protein n=1 Tax=Sphingosinicella sp. LHD-64 TaxID=3072139 RepID=UPI0028108953|nr:hypothetical protein [Sphingosinicella sp. LHD-64]MDQ8755804.1 hypothetical protein [Sphingosinicella sp. LHD-64]
MTFHEKSRWIALLANLAAWSWYFVAVARLHAAGVPNVPYMIAMMLPVIVAITVIHIVAHVAVALWKPGEARSETDEREQAIARRAASIAYNVLAVGLVLAVGATLFNWTAFFAVNAVMLVFILAESVRYTLEIVAYRRMAA